jgi:hypothetical protein
MVGNSRNIELKIKTLIIRFRELQVWRINWPLLYSAGFRLGEVLGCFMLGGFLD